MTRHVILRHVKLAMIEVRLMVVQEILMNNIKMKRMTITLTLNLKKIELNRNCKKKSGIGYYPIFFIQSNQSGYV